MFQRRGDRTRTMWVRRLFSILIFTYLGGGVIGPFLVSSVAGRQCTDWTGRYVASYDASTEQILEMAAQTPLAEVPILPAGVSGMTIPGTTLVVDESGARVVAHEAVHHLQIQDDGYLLFAWRYVHEWMQGVYSGCGPHDAYRAISYEVQARRAADSVVWETRTSDLSATQFTGTLQALHDQGRLGALVPARQ